MIKYDLDIKVRQSATRRQNTRIRIATVERVNIDENE